MEPQLTNDEINEQFYKEYATHCRIADLKLKVQKGEFKSLIKNLVKNVDEIYEWLDENDNWAPVEIVEVTPTDEKELNYTSYDFAYVTNDIDKLGKILYMKVPENEKEYGIDHYYVWQRQEYEDSFYGFLLIPLSNGKYFKVSYSC